MMLITQKAQSQTCPDAPIIVGSTSLCRSNGNYEIINFNSAFSNLYAIQCLPIGSGSVFGFNNVTGTFAVNWLVTTPCSLLVSLVSPRAILNLEVDDENIGLRIRNEYLNTQENTTPRCFDNLGRQINCPDKWDAKVIKRKTKSGDFIIVK